jgi:hypothetical protein
MRNFLLAIIGFALACVVVAALSFIFAQVPVMLLQGLPMILTAMGITALLIAAIYQLGRLFFYTLNKEKSNVS